MRVRDAAAQDLDPARALADTAALAAANGAAHVHLGGRFRKREIGGAQTRLDVLAKHGVNERVERSLQIAERQSLVHDEALDLHKDGGMRCVDLIHAENAPGHDEAERRLHGLERTDLAGRGMRTKHDVVVDIERVLHIARGMIRGQVEKREVVLVQLDLGTAEERKAHADERIADLAVGLCHRMQAACRQRANTRCGNVDTLPLKARSLRSGLERGAALVQRGLDSLLDTVCFRTDGGALFRCELAHLTQNACELSGFPEQLHAKLFELFRGLACLELFDRLFTNRFQRFQY